MLRGSGDDDLFGIPDDRAIGGFSGSSGSSGGCGCGGGIFLGRLLGRGTRGGLEVAHGEVDDMALVEKPEKVSSESLFALLHGLGIGSCRCGRGLGRLNDIRGRFRRGLCSGSFRFRRSLGCCRSGGFRGFCPECEECGPLLVTALVRMRLEVLEDGAEVLTDRGGLPVEIAGTRHGDVDDLLVRLEELESASGEFLADRLGQRKRETVHLAEVLEQQFAQELCRVVQGGAAGEGDLSLGGFHLVLRVVLLEVGRGLLERKPSLFGGCRRGAFLGDLLFCRNVALRGFRRRFPGGCCRRCALFGGCGWSDFPGGWKFGSLGDLGRCHRFRRDPALGNRSHGRFLSRRRLIFRPGGHGDVDGLGRLLALPLLDEGLVTDHADA